MVLSHIDIQTRMCAVNFENVGKPQMSEPAYLDVQPLYLMFKLNGISNPYQLDQSISVLRLLVFFHFIQILMEPCKQIVETLIRHRILRCLVWVCTICLRSTKKDARLIWVKTAINYGADQSVQMHSLMSVFIVPI